MSTKVVKTVDQDYASEVVLLMNQARAAGTAVDDGGQRDWHGHHLLLSGSSQEVSPDTYVVSTTADRRAELNRQYTAAVDQGGGSESKNDYARIGELMAVKVQNDDWSALERARIARYSSSIRSALHQSVRLDAHASIDGPIDWRVRHVSNLIAAASQTPDPGDSP